MKRLLLVAMCCLLGTIQLYAKILRVNNNNMTFPAYVNGQQAHDDAQPGDTIYFESSSTAYPSFNVTKRLVIMGVGVFLNSYDGYQLPGLPEAAVSQINIGGEASHTVVAGLKANIAVDGAVSLRLFSNHGRIDLTGTANVLVYHSYITRLRVSRAYSVAITNNIIVGNIENDSSAEDIAIHHNTISGNIFAWNSDLTNNIIVQGSANLITSNFANNVLSFSSYYKGGVEVTSDSFNNVLGVAMADIFMATYLSDDRYYQLKPTSPARGAGLGGVDCGATGGADPYVFGALQPPVPSIYRLDVPGVVSGNSMQVTIGTRVNK